MTTETMVTVSPAELRELLDGQRQSLRVSESLDAPESTPIIDCNIGAVVTIAGVVTNVGDRNTFNRDDGSEGQVRNVQIQDRTGMIEVALWGEEADRDITVGDVMQVWDGEVEEGYNDATQLNAGYDTRVRVFDQQRDAELVTLVLEDEDA